MWILWTRFWAGHQRPTVVFLRPSVPTNPDPQAFKQNIHYTVARCYSGVLLFEVVHGRIPTEMSS